MADEPDVDWEKLERLIRATDADEQEGSVTEPPGYWIGLWDWHDDHDEMIKSLNDVANDIGEDPLTDDEEAEIQNHAGGIGVENDQGFFEFHWKSSADELKEKWAEDTLEINEPHCGICADEVTGVGKSYPVGKCNCGVKEDAPYHECGCPEEAVSENDEGDWYHRRCADKGGLDTACADEGHDASGSEAPPEEPDEEPFEPIWGSPERENPHGNR